MLSLTDVVTLKSEIKERFGFELHYHDACPKPYYTLDQRNEDAERFITEFLADRGERPSFSKDGLHFTV